MPIADLISAVLLFLMCVVGLAVTLAEAASPLPDAHRSAEAVITDGSDKAAVYRALARQYANEKSPDGGGAARSRLRRRMSALCWEIAKERLPCGTDKATVIGRLGPPVCDLGFMVLYYGDRRGYFHLFRFEDGKLERHVHTLMLDLEGGR